MEKIHPKFLAKQMNLIVQEAKSLRGDMPKELWDHVFQIIRRLSLGIHSEQDIGQGLQFVKQFESFLDVNNETIEKVKKEVDGKPEVPNPDLVGASENCVKPSLIIH